MASVSEPHTRLSELNKIFHIHIYIYIYILSGVCRSLYSWHCNLMH